jgi:hypothetical protein
MEGRGMSRSLVRVVAIVIAGTAVISSCKKDESSTGTQGTPGPTLSASAASVTVGGGQQANVTISGGTNPYAIGVPPNPAIASAQFVNANLDTAVLIITGVTTATGSTAVVVRDASTPQKSVAISIVKTP